MVREEKKNEKEILKKQIIFYKDDNYIETINVKAKVQQLIKKINLVHKRT